MSETLDSRDSADVRRVDMIYTIEDTPPWYLCVFLGLQVNIPTHLPLWMKLDWKLLMQRSVACPCSTTWHVLVELSQYRSSLLRPCVLDLTSGPPVSLLGPSSSAWASQRCFRPRWDAGRITSILSCLSEVLLACRRVSFSGHQWSVFNRNYLKSIAWCNEPFNGLIYKVIEILISCSLTGKWCWREDIIARHCTWLMDFPGTISLIVVLQFFLHPLDSFLPNSPPFV